MRNFLKFFIPWYLTYLFVMVVILHVDSEIMQYLLENTSYLDGFQKDLGEYNRQLEEISRLSKTPSVITGPSKQVSENLQEVPQREPLMVMRTLIVIAISSAVAIYFHR
uniref:Uncharacterized protein n=1 Tax=Pleurocladia lacustris TaxID=246121 RepID=A0A1I9LW66_9PHAE|nr:hypothetical protein [Pleurocladia lacustris]ANS57836.1 hypothetical protein [Pleurocladia lacustris]